MTTTTDEAIAAGAQLGRFVVTRPLGAGGMGTVYEARDPELGRAVAIKLLRDDRADPAWLLREAQALATLSHPNVVAIYELGAHDGQVFLAMELIDGVSLDRHLASGDRSWRDVLALYVQAGRGLAAVHARALVHRDLKPSNLLIDAAGRVRVSDFGLARRERSGATGDTAALDGGIELAATIDGGGGELDAPATAPPAAGLLASPLTADGAVIGTPRYMAPEQHRGGPVTRHADQFAFCVALWEGLYGAHPFADDDLPTLRAAVLAGRRRAPPRGRGVPAWLERALGRGLAVDPSARWPSIDALVDVLEGTPRRRRAIALGGGALAIGSALIAIAVLRGGGADGDPCGAVARPIDPIWSPARAATLRTAVLAADPTLGAARWDAMHATLDRRTSQWRAMATDVCRANRVTHRESDTLHDRRVACLDRRLIELRTAAATVAAAADPDGIDRAVVAVNRVPALDACADAEALLARTPPPDDPARRQAVDALTAEADAVARALAVAGHVGLLDRTAALIAQARTAAHPPALARALQVDALVRFSNDGTSSALATLRELTEVAAAAHDDDLAAWAWTHLLQEIGQGQGKYDEAIALLPVARAAVQRAGASPHARVRMLAASAMVLAGAGRADEGLAALAEARALLTAADPTTTEPRTAALLGDLEYQAATIDHTAGRPERAEPAFRRAIALTTTAFGADHPETAITWQGLGEALRWQGKPDEALVAYQTAARIREARGGASTGLAAVLSSVAAAQFDLGRHDDALASLARAVAIFRGAGEASRRDLALALMTEGLALRGLGRTADARARYDESIAIFDTLEGSDPNHAIALHNRGGLAAGQDDCVAALPDLRRAVALNAAALGEAHPWLVYPLSSIGACEHALGELAAAIATFDRALAIPSSPTAAHVLVRFTRGRALVESGRDRAGGLAAARAARAEMDTVAGAAALIESSDAWLRTRRR